MHRRGSIDRITDLRTMDLVRFNDGVNPFGNDFIRGGFSAGAEHYRSVVEEWGFVEKGAVADIGSGYGRWSMFLAEVNPSVCGYERNRGAIELSEKLACHFALPNVRFEVADVTALPATDGSYDAAWCYNTLQFVDRAKCLSNIHRVLKPGGSLFIGAYNGVGRVLEKFFQGYAAGGLDNHVAKFALRSLRQGPAFDAGNGNYASAEHIEAVLGRFGFALCKSPGLKREMSPKAVDTDRYANALQDLPALAARIEEDRIFTEEFVRHPEVAYRFPMNLDFCAVKR